MARKPGQIRKTDRMHDSFLVYRNFRYLKIAIAVSLLFILVYMFSDPYPVHNGGTWLGYILGTVGALLIVWLTMLGLRKRSINPGFWSLKSWTSAHVYLGLALIVIGTLHTGFQFGWNIHTAAYVLMMLVILSGIWGIYTYARYPREMSDNKSGRTRAELLQDLSDVDEEIRAAGMTLDHRFVAEVDRSIEKSPITGSLLRKLSGRVRNCGTEKAIENVTELAKAVPPEQSSEVTRLLVALRRKGDLLSRLRRDIQIKAILDTWLFFHIPLTFALWAALIAHIVAVFFYW